MTRAKNSALSALSAASLSAGCACPNEMTVSFGADVQRSVGPLETTMYIDAESGSREADVPQLCRHVTRDIAAYRWDLDGDGVYETPADSPTRTIRFEDPGVYVVGVEARDERGKRRTKSLTFEVFPDSDPAAVLALLQFGARVSMDFSCQVSVCAGVRLDYEGVTLDELVLRDGAGQALAAREAVALVNDGYVELCVPAAGLDVSDVVAEVRWHGASVQAPVAPLAADDFTASACDAGLLPAAP